MAKNVIITKTARKKLVQARAGIISLPKIVWYGFWFWRREQQRRGRPAD